MHLFKVLCHRPNLVSATFSVSQERRGRGRWCGIRKSPVPAKADYGKGILVSVATAADLGGFPMVMHVRVPARFLHIVYLCRMFVFGHVPQDETWNGRRDWATGRQLTDTNTLSYSVAHSARPSPVCRPSGGQGQVRSLWSSTLDVLCLIPEPRSVRLVRWQGAAVFPSKLRTILKDHMSGSGGVRRQLVRALLDLCGTISQLSSGYG